MARLRRTISGRRWWFAPTVPEQNRGLTTPSAEMPPAVIDLQKAEDARDVIHRAVQALAEGQLVAFPSETVYYVAASALNEDAVARLVATTGNPQDPAPALAVKSAEDALDYVPDLSPLGCRLARRCWPGPVTLLVSDNHPEGLTEQLPRSVRGAVTLEGLLGLCSPAHPVLHDVLRLLPGPVALAGVDRSGAHECVTAQDVVEMLDEKVQLVLDDGRSRFGQPASVVRIDGNRYEVLRTGVVSPQVLKRMASYLVLLVCTGNTCRSPLAEVMLRRLIAKRLNCDDSQVADRGYEVMSAGLSAMNGGRASAESLSVAAEAGLDLREHGSQPVTRQLVRHADLILTMTRMHREAIVNEWPDAGPRTHVLCRDGRDVADPIGGPIEAYQQCAAQMRGELESWLQEIPF
mgnify:CR=1 FL=1